jgi:hypothetical protein
MIGFVGVLVGAVITTGANYLLAVRKEKAEAARDKLFRTNELKTAARLIADDLFTAQTAVMEFVDNKRWAPTAARNFPLEAWQKNREVLARELPLEDWNAVEIAVWTVERSLVRTTLWRKSASLFSMTSKLDSKYLYHTCDEDVEMR